MSYKSYKKTFESASVSTGDTIAVVDALDLNWLSFQVQAVLAGGTVDVDFTVQEANDNDDGDFLDTAQTQNYAAAATINKMFSFQQATSRWYRIKVTIANGTVTGLEVNVIGKG